MIYKNRKNRKTIQNREKEFLYMKGLNYTALTVAIIGAKC